MDLQLRDKAVLVTGGTKGIGRAIVQAFLDEGAQVATVGRGEQEGRTLERELSAAGHRFRFFAADLSRTADCRRVYDETLAAFGRFDVLVNNVGVNDGVNLEAGAAAFLLSLQRNLVHCYELVHCALEELKQHQGAIVNVGSKVSVTGQGGTSGYAAAKGALNALTREWAVDLAPYGVRANCVIPAEVWTPLYENWLATTPDPAAARRQIEQLIPLGRRFTTSEEIAVMVVFLASPRSSHTTGQIVFVDGGYTHLDRKSTA
ncbi:MAG: SDR family oxidoreductase [Pirellulaceae bacterium]